MESIIAFRLMPIKAYFFMILNSFHTYAFLIILNVFFDMVLLYAFFRRIQFDGLRRSHIRTEAPLGLSYCGRKWGPTVLSNRVSRRLGRRKHFLWPRAIIWSNFMLC